MINLADVGTASFYLFLWLRLT